MKLRTMMLILVILSLIPCLDAFAQSGAAAGRGRLKGTVSDPDGNPIEGVLIRFSSERLGASFELTSDKEGNWIAAGMAGGTWAIDFIKEGFVMRGITYAVATLSYNKPIILSLERAQVASTVSAPTQQEEDPARDKIIEGNALSEQGDHAGAIAKYEEALTLNPELRIMYGEIGNLYLRMDQRDKALESFKKLLESEPENTDARISAANILLDDKKSDEAKTLLEGLALAEVTNPNTLYNLGARFYNIQETVEAVRYWEKAIEMDPQFVDAYFQLGAAYLSLQENEKSKAMFQKVIELDPESENAVAAKEMLEVVK